VELPAARVGVEGWQLYAKDASWNETAEVEA